MGYTRKNNIKLAIEIESTEGVAVNPTGSSSFLMPMADGLEINPSRELLERNILDGSIGKVAARMGRKSVEASIPLEVKAGDSAGAAPKMDPLLRSAMGGRRQGQANTTKTGNSATVLQIEDADISDYKKGDVVLVKEAGRYHRSAIKSVITTSGSASIELEQGRSGGGSFPDNVVLEAFTTYFTANSGHPSLTVTKYVEDARKEQAIGCKVASMSLENFSTAQLSTLNFGLTGLNFKQELAAPTGAAIPDVAQTPIILNAKIFLNGQEIQVNEFSISLENTLAAISYTGSENGNVAQLVSERGITGSLNPYKMSDDLSNYTKWVNGTQFSLLITMGNPGNAEGEVKESISIWLPSCMITEMSEADQDGNLTESLTFMANRGDGSTEEMYITTH